MNTEKSNKTQTNKFEKGDIIELVGIKGQIHCVYPCGSIEVIWEKDNKRHIITPESPMYDCLVKLPKEELNIFQKYPIGSKWLIEVEVTKYNFDDDLFPLEVETFINKVDISVPTLKLSSLIPISEELNKE
jgi:hypothetical protein